MQDPVSSQTYWRSIDSYADDLSNAFETVDGDHRDPSDTIAVAVALARAADVLPNMLASDWSLYTAKHGAAAASAAFSVVESASRSLRALVDAMALLEERGDVPSHPGIVKRLLATADALEEIAGGSGLEVVTQLADLPCPVQLASHQHEVVVRIAEMLGPNVVLRDSSHEPDHTTDRCRCDVLIERDGVTWSFHQGDGRWSLGSELDYFELDAWDGNTDPRHLVEQIHDAIGV